MCIYICIYIYIYISNNNNNDNSSTSLADSCHGGLKVVGHLFVFHVCMFLLNFGFFLKSV